MRFICGKDKFERRIKKVKAFKTISALLKEYKYSEINPNIKSAKDLEMMYYSFPSYLEKIRNYGLIALEL